ncbi:FAD-binding domain-containing protein [Lepidopterella palustris CBS 459.81]|uniref:FAD-binding domain-containing protein n=1 Tax=Lepidopterella palustris CBS 459.81 TaxID=1314670 RepID=A0A8E2JGJ7_9PEZI|nr:FAD-binding domain-containing protein [Lepidopterella palustris CBS 459.81]
MPLEGSLHIYFTLANLTNFEIEYPRSANYDCNQTQYRSTGFSALQPSCILSPTAAEEVAAIIKVLNQNNDSVAVKSGGHNQNQYFASIAGGPLISTRKMDEVSYDPSSVADRIGPSNRWQDVQLVLNDSGVAVVGDRIGNWQPINLVEFELILSNSSIITASSTSDPDLFKVLKGGHMGRKPHPLPSATPLLLSALRDFTEYYPDKCAGIILTAKLTLLGTIDLWIMFLFYKGPSPPPGVFNNFTDIGPIINTFLAVPRLLGSIAFQPVPKRILVAAKAAIVDLATQKLYGEIRERVLAFTAEGMLPEAYLPLFMNYGYWREDYFGWLRTREFPRGVRKRFDLGYFFKARTWGFKM